MQVEVVRDASSLDGLVVTRGIIHWYLIYLFQGTQIIIRGSATDEYTHFATSNVVLGNSGILKSFICALQEVSLLWI